MYEGGDNKKRFGELSRSAFEHMGEFCFRDVSPFLGWMDVLTGFEKRLKNNSEGGPDTSSATMEWAMTELMKNPTKIRKAQEEVRQVVRNKYGIDQEHIDQMNYLKMCCQRDSLRLHPPVPFLVPRELNKSTRLGSYDIPPKTRVFINAWAIQWDPKLWDRPEEVLPERSVDSPIDFKGNDFQFILFGAGQRSCPGMLFGVIQVEYALANLLYWFDWKLVGGAGGNDLDMSEAYGLVMHKKIRLQLVPVTHSPAFLK
ncbi:hypothetical protein RHMOL_Rhmol08G0247500 [Rhododendron molle]|uniref:Uncharacterized protein n=1 Tax=Rhododendron molle TaxID=49168 RepID=A0ACC0MRY4_RHOML|nr:hypothetical protein RHMOL_Rhmol08G0247500 [Rhododendron molle]